MTPCFRAVGWATGRHLVSRKIASKNLKSLFLLDWTSLNSNCSSKPGQLNNAESSDVVEAFFPMLRCGSKDFFYEAMQLMFEARHGAAEKLFKEATRGSKMRQEL